MGVRVATSSVTALGGAVILGAGIGMIVGDYTVGRVWGKTGQRKVRRFYSGQGHYWKSDSGTGYFNAYENSSRILNHYI